METSTPKHLIDFASSLNRAVSDLVGDDKVAELLLQKFPNKEIVPSLVGEVIVSEQANLSEVLKIFFEENLLLLEKNFGSDFTEAKINSLYKKFSEKNIHEKTLHELLFLIPLKYLEYERVKNMSKLELENYALEKSREIKNLNKNIENAIKNRTDKIEQLLQEKNVSENLLLKKINELKSYTETLIKNDKKKNEFVGMAAHQLRTPLSGIKWTLALIINGDFGPLTEDQKTFLIKTSDSTNRLITLVNDILGFENLYSGDTEYNFVPEFAQDIMDNLIFEMQTLANKKGIKIDFDHKNTQSMPKIMLDKEKIRAVFQNLIENAIKYTKDNGIISVNFAQNNGSLEISINDQGIGIPDAQKQNIFKQFFRATNAIKMESEGTGLGLFIAKTIVERHGGTISFESKENIGTTFFIKLPIIK